MKTIRELLKTSRPISWVNTAYPFAAGYLITHGHVDTLLIVGTLFFLIPYNLLMYGINDVFDYESDRQNARKGGVQGSVLEKQFHTVVLDVSLVLNVPFVIWLLTKSSLPAAVVLLVVLADVVAYSAPVVRLKERALLDSISSSLHFVGPLVYALALTGSVQRALPVIVAFFLWGMASHAFGAVQDIAADRAAHIGSIATVIGARRTVRLAIALYALAAILVFVSTLPAWPVALCGGLYIANILRYWNISDREATSAQAGWKRFIWINWITGAVLTMVLLVVK